MPVPRKLVMVEYQGISNGLAEAMVDLGAGNPKK
jgi:hypothetical protein